MDDDLTEVFLVQQKILAGELAAGDRLPSEREMIATFVSTRNDCYFCQTSHRAAAAHHLGGNYELVDAVRADYQNAAVSPKLKALLTIAGKVQESGRSVTTEDVAAARSEVAFRQELIALALAEGHLSADEAWAAAHVDEDWNIAQWGEDELAMQRRAFRFAEFAAAAMVLRLL